jgi:hypothetical protein
MLGLQLLIVQNVIQLYCLLYQQNLLTHWQTLDNCK